MTDDLRSRHMLLIDEVAKYRKVVESDLRILQSDEYDRFGLALLQRYNGYRRRFPVIVDELTELLDEELEHMDAERNFVEHPTALRSQRLRTRKDELNVSLTKLLQREHVDAAVDSDGVIVRDALRGQLNYLAKMRNEAIDELRDYIVIPSTARQLAKDGDEIGACDMLLDFIALHLSVSKSR